MATNEFLRFRIIHASALGDRTNISAPEPRWALFGKACYRRIGDPSVVHPNWGFGRLTVGIGGRKLTYHSRSGMSPRYELPTIHSERDPEAIWQFSSGVT